MTRMHRLFPRRGRRGGPTHRRDVIYGVKEKRHGGGDNASEEGGMFTSINLKLELECLMSEPKRDIWGLRPPRDEQVKFFKSDFYTASLADWRQ